MDLPEINTTRGADARIIAELRLSSQIDLAVDLDAFADWDLFVAAIAISLAFALVMAVIGPDLARRRAPDERLARRRRFGV